MDSKNDILSYHISRLSDKRESVKLDAIKVLELLGDTAAIDALQSVYRNTNETAGVRSAAQKAGRVLFLKKCGGKPMTDVGLQQLG